MQAEGSTGLCEAFDFTRFGWPLPSGDEDSWFIVNSGEEEWESIQKKQPLFSEDKLLHFAFVNNDRTVEYNEHFIKNLHKFINDHADRLKSVILHFACVFPSHPDSKATKPSFLDWKWCTNGESFDKLEYLYLGDPKYQITKVNRSQISKFLPYVVTNTKEAELAAQMAKGAAKNAKKTSTKVSKCKEKDSKMMNDLVVDKAFKIIAEEAAVRTKKEAKKLKIATADLKNAKKTAASSQKDKKKETHVPADDVPDLAALKANKLKLEKEATMKADLNAKITKKVAALRGEEMSADVVTKESARLDNKKGTMILFLARKMVANIIAELAAELAAEIATKQNFKNLKDFVLVGIDSERTMYKLITFAIDNNERQDIDCTLHLSYGEKSEVPPWTGTPYNILQQFSYYAPEGEYQMKRPREYEYALMAKLAYSLKNHTNGTWLKGLKIRNGVFGIKPLVIAGEEEEIPQEMPDYYWLTMRGWRCVKYIHEPFFKGANYTGAVLFNKYTRQIVLANRGTVVNLKTQDFGALTSDVKGIVLGKDCGQHKAAKEFLHRLLGDTLGISDNPILDPSICGKIHLVPRCEPGNYNEVKAEKEEGIHPRFNLSFTGHSLGAWLSEVLVAEACLEGYYTSSVTFDSPGSEFVFKKLLKCDISNLDCVGFVGSPNLVNTCNGRVGEVKSILNATPRAISSLQTLGNDVREWLISSLAFHSADNFIRVGTRFQKDLVAATHIGEWPVCTNRSWKNIFLLFVSFCKGHYKYMISTGLECLRNRLTLTEKTPLSPKEWEESCDSIKDMAKDNPFPLALREYYSFPLVRLHPRAQQLVEIYTSFSTLKRAEISGRILPEFSTLMDPIKQIKSNGIVIIKKECGVAPLKQIDKLNSFLKTTTVFENHKKILLQTVSVEDQFHSFTTFVWPSFFPT